MWRKRDVAIDAERVSRGSAPARARGSIHTHGPHMRAARALSLPGSARAAPPRAWPWRPLLTHAGVALLVMYACRGGALGGALGGAATVGAAAVSAQLASLRTAMAAAPCERAREQVAVEVRGRAHSASARRRTAARARCRPQHACTARAASLDLATRACAPGPRARRAFLERARLARSCAARVRERAARAATHRDPTAQCPVGGFAQRRAQVARRGGGGRHVRMCYCHPRSARVSVC